MSFIAPVNANRPSYHITPESNWLNDPQRPFLLGGEWHLYYLFNADFNEVTHSTGGGTEWYHVTSTDLVYGTRYGVAIEKYKPHKNGINIGDIETGSAVVVLRRRFSDHVEVVREAGRVSALIWETLV
jgi:levanase